MKKSNYSLEKVCVVHYPAQSKERGWKVYGRLEELVVYSLIDPKSGKPKERIRSIHCLQLLLDHKGNTSFQNFQKVIIAQ